jgi:hypothetical protein
MRDMFRSTFQKRLRRANEDKEKKAQQSLGMPVKACNKPLRDLARSVPA